MRRAATAVLCCALLSGCGTTVPLTRTSVSSGDALAAPGTTVAGGTSGASTGTAAGLSGAAPVGGAAAGRSAPVSRGTGTGTAVAPAPMTAVGGIRAKGQGWDAKNVYLGIIVETDAGNALHALGVSIDPGDELGDARAVVADLNRRGGLYGRQVVLVVKDDKSASVLADPVSAGQADCAYFSQDHPTIAVVNTDAALDTESFRGCFAHAHVPLVTLTTTAFENSSTAAFEPYYYNALSVSWSQLTDVLVQRLQAQGYFSGWNATTGSASPAAKTKVGVLYGSSPSSSRIGPMLLAALHRAGYQTDSFQYSSQGDMSSAVLRFAGSGVTHVVTDGYTFFFATAARSQHYLPRYGITTDDAPQVLLEGNSDHTQLAGALGVGWYPTLDVDEAQDPGPGPGTSACLAALKAGGQTFSGKRFAAAFGFAVCDGLRLAVFAAQAGGGLDPASIRNGIVARGRDFPTGGSFASGLTATNFGMPGAGRDLGFDSGCSCFTYRGGSYPL